MRVAYIQAFRTVILNVLEAYGFENVRAREIVVVDQAVLRPRSVGVRIALEGGANGALVLAFPSQDAVTIASHMIGQELSEEHMEDVRAIIAELANIAAGNVTGELYRLGLDVDISLPTIQPGPEVAVDLPEGAEGFAAPFVTRQGDFELLVSLSELQPVD